MPNMEGYSTIKNAIIKIAMYDAPTMLHETIIFDLVVLKKDMIIPATDGGMPNKNNPA